MTNTYKWSQIIPSGLNSVSIDGQTLQQVFTTIDWRMSGTDGTNTSDTYGQVSLGPPNPASFTPAANVTQDQLVAWLSAALGADQLAACKARIDADIASLAAPPTFTGTPLSNISC